MRTGINQNFFLIHLFYFNLQSKKNEDLTKKIFYNQTMENKRIDWIDTAKGIGIFLVVLGHNSIPPVVFSYFFSFHMPLFFFLSGFLFSSAANLNFQDFFLKKTKTLLAPYLFLGFLVYSYWLAVVQKFSLANSDLLKPLADLLYGSVHLDTIFTPLWFLLSLFLTELFFFIIVKKFPKFYLIPVLVLSLIGFLTTFGAFKNLPWSVNTSLIALIFFGLGYYLKNNSKDLINNLTKNRLVVLITIIFLLMSVWFFYLNGTIDMLNNHYQNYLYFVLSAFGGIGIILVISQLIPNSKVVNFVGKNSLIILALHSIGISLGRSLIGLIEKITSITFTDEKSMLFGLFYSMFAILIITPVIYLINNYLPWIIGKQKP